MLGTPTRIGENGQGLALKLAINISLGVQMLAFSEGLLLAERDGVDRKLPSDVMLESAIGSPMLKLRAPLVLDLPQEAWFDVGLPQKDIGLALDMASDLGIRLPSTGAIAEMLATAVELGYEHRDIAALFEVLARTNRRVGRTMKRYARSKATRPVRTQPAASPARSRNRFSRP